MRGRTDAARAKVELARIAARELNELLERFRGNRWMDEQTILDDGDLRYRRKIFCGIVVEFRIQRRADRDQRRAQDNRVTIGRRFRCELEPEVATCAGSCVSDELLSGLVGKFLRDCTAEQIRRPARGKRKNYAYRFDGIRLSNNAVSRTHERGHSKRNA